MRKILYILIVAAAFLTPEEKQDLGKLLPVEVVSLRYENDLVVIETDTGELGSGIGVAAAIKNLEESASGVVYLDTADHLLISEEAQALLPDIAPYLKGKLGLHLCAGSVDLERAARYLSARRSQTTLKEAVRGKGIPELIVVGERFLEIKRN